jgi:hypothetical protein
MCFYLCYKMHEENKLWAYCPVFNLFALENLLLYSMGKVIYRHLMVKNHYSSNSINSTRYFH